MRKKIEDELMCVRCKHVEHCGADIPADLCRQFEPRAAIGDGDAGGIQGVDQELRHMSFNNYHGEE